MIRVRVTDQLVGRLFGLRNYQKVTVIGLGQNVVGYHIGDLTMILERLARKLVRLSQFNLALRCEFADRIYSWLKSPKLWMIFASEL